MANTEGRASMLGLSLCSHRSARTLWPFIIGMAALSFPDGNSWDR